MNKKSIRYYIYARKSSESSERQVQSIEDQIERLNELAKSLGLNIIHTYTEAKSAKKPDNRPVFEEMMKNVEAGKADGILCWQLNRLSRNPIDSARINWLLQQDVLKSVQTSDREYCPGDNVVVFSVESSIANQFIIDLKKNTRRGVLGKLKRGGYPSRAPLGYRNDKLEKTIIRDEKIWELVRQMWDMMLTGNYTPSKITEIANNQWKFKTPTYWRNGGKPLSKSTVYNMFHNRFYAGIMEWGGDVYDGNHDKMITPLEFDRVQKLIGGTKTMSPSQHKYEFAYTGMMSCGECGGTITAEKKNKKLKDGTTNTYTYYRCTKSKKYSTCNQKGSLSKIELEKQISKYIQKLTIDDVFLQWALDGLNEAHDTEVSQQKKIREMQQKSLNNLKDNLSGLTQMRYRNLIDDEEFISEKTRLRNDIEELEQTIASTEEMNNKWMEMTERTFNFAAHAHKSFTEGDLQTKREIFRALGSNFQIQDKTLYISTHSWLQVLENSYPELKAEIEGCAPEKFENNLINKEKNRTFVPSFSMFPSWGDYRESNPNCRYHKPE